MSFIPLSLSPVGVIDLTLSPISSPNYVFAQSPLYPPPDYEVGQSPIVTPSDYVPQSHTVPHPGYNITQEDTGTRRVRDTRRCSICRQTGHDVRRCQNSSAIFYLGHIYNRYDNPRDNLTHFVYARTIQRVPQLNNHPSLLQNLFEDLFFHVQSYSFRQLRTAQRNPLPTINYAYQQLIIIIDNERILQSAASIRLPATPHLRGIEYAKSIELENDACQKEAIECFICCDQNCSVTSSCGHEYCVTCVTKILNENKNKTKAPVCSFCKTPFQKFAVSVPASFEALSSFIQNLS